MRVRYYKGNWFRLSEYLDGIRDLDRVPSEIRAMSGVPSAVRKSRTTRKVHPLPNADDPIWALGPRVVQMFAEYLDNE